MKGDWKVDAADEEEANFFKMRVCLKGEKTGSFLVKCCAFKQKRPQGEFDFENFCFLVHTHTQKETNTHTHTDTDHTQTLFTYKCTNTHALSHTRTPMGEQGCSRAAPKAYISCLVAARDDCCRRNSCFLKVFSAAAACCWAFLIMGVSSRKPRTRKLARTSLCTLVSVAAAALQKQMSEKLAGKSKRS